MASNLQLCLTLKAARLNLYSTQLGTSCVLELYNGTQPATPDTAISSQVLLCSQVCSSTFAATTSTATLTVNAIADGAGTAAATGGGTTATWGRFRTAAAGVSGLGIFDVSVGASGTDLIVTPDAVIKTSQAVSVTSLVINA